MFRFNSTTSLVLAVLAIVGMAGPVAAEDSVPFKGSLEGALTNRIPFPAPPVFLDTIEMSGTATQLGRFELVLIAEVNLGVVPPYAEGDAMFVAANGDTLTAEFTGTSVLVAPDIVLITENVIITGGTGRFSGASGSFTIQRLFDRITLMNIGSFDGTISQPRG